MIRVLHPRLARAVCSIKYSCNIDNESEVLIMSTQAADVISPIELIVEQDEAGQVAANVPVRWKISSEMIAALVGKTVDPFMLLVVTNGGQEMDRIIQPLKSGMTFIQMRRPGANVIHATIVWQRDWRDPVKRIVNKKNDYGEHVLDLVRSFIPGMSEVVQRIDELDEIIQWNEDGLDDAAINTLKVERKQLQAKRVELGSHEKVYGLFDFFQAIERSVEGDQIIVEVPDEMFAPPPPRWMTRLGSMYNWPRRLRDQCDLRGRVFFTSISLPFVAVVVVAFGAVALIAWSLFKLFSVLVAGLLLFFGMRNIGYSVIYKPDNMNIGELWNDLNPSFWTHKKVDVERPNSYYPGGVYTVTEYQPRDVAFRYVNPPFMLLVFVVGEIGIYFFFGHSSILGAVLGTVGGVLLAGGISSLVARSKIVHKETTREKKVVTPEQKTKLERDLAALTSGGAAKLSELPMSQRTVRLRFLNLKASVCRPFAR